MKTYTRPPRDRAEAARRAVAAMEQMEADIAAARERQAEHEEAKP